MCKDFEITVIGIGHAGRLAARCFPDLDDHRISKIQIDTLEAFNKDSYEDPAAAKLLILKASPSKSGLTKSDSSMSQSFGTIRSRLSSALSSAEGVILFAGLGGKTGGAIAPLVARLSAATNIPVISQVYLPWALEGAQIAGRAQKNLGRLLPHCVYTSVINNNQIGNVVSPDAGLSRLLSAKAALQAWHAIDVLRVVRAV